MAKWSLKAVEKLINQIANSEADNQSSNNILWTLSIVEFAIIILLTITLVINIKKNNKINLSINPNNSI